MIRAPAPSTTQMKAALFAIACLTILMGCDSGSARYPGPWREDLNVEITKTLVAKKVKGCGEYKYRETHRHEYLVHCSRDGKNWIAYQVWPKIGEITGPHAEN